MNRKIISLAFVVTALILLLWLTQKIPYCGWDFHNNLWGPVNMLINHSTPYTFHAPYGPYPGVWMPSTLGLFFFIGYLPCDIASKLWLLAEMAGMIWAIWMIADYKFPSPWVFAICLVVFLLYPPLWYHITLGQFSMLFVILMMAKVYLPRADRFTPLLLVLGLTKPQLAILVYPGLLLWTCRNKGFRKAGWMVLSIGILVVLSTIPLFLYVPNWLGDFLSVTFDNLGFGWNLPTLYVQLPVLMGTAGYVIWAIVFLAAFATSLWLWSQKNAKIALVASLAMTPIVTPYASSWDFMLLMPAFFWLIIKLKTKSARAVLLVGMVSLFIAQIAARWHQNVEDGTQWWLSLALILLYLMSLAVEYSGVLNKIPIKLRFVR